MNKTRHTAIRARGLLSVLAIASLAACTAGPDFRRPAAPDVSAYTSTALPAQTWRPRACWVRRHFQPGAGRSAVVARARLGRTR